MSTRLVQIKRHPQFGFDVVAPGQAIVWCADRAIAARTAWSLAERLAPVSRRELIADGIARLAAIGAEIANQVT